MKKNNLIAIFAIVFLIMLSIGLLRYNVYLMNDGSPLLGFAIDPPVEEPPNPSGCPCPGDVQPNTCDVNNPPFYCEVDSEGNCNFIKNCEACGCTADEPLCDAYSGACLSDPSLYRCSDGTYYKQCSQERPLYCNYNRKLVNDCEECGCPLGYICGIDGSCIVQVNVDNRNKNIDDIIILLEMKIRLEKERQEDQIKYLEFTLDLGKPFSKLMAPTFKKISSELPVEKPEIIVEELTREQILKSPNITNTTQIPEITPQELPDKFIKISGLTKQPTDPLDKLSPPIDIKNFEISFFRKDNKPQLILDLRDIPKIL